MILHYIMIRNNPAWKSGHGKIDIVDLEPCARGVIYMETRVNACYFASQSI